jgi:hypothetical protein
MKGKVGKKFIPEHVTVAGQNVRNEKPPVRIIDYPILLPN